MRSGTRGVAGLIGACKGAVPAPRRTFVASHVKSQIDHHDLPDRVKLLLNPPSTSTASSSPDIVQIQALVTPLLQATSSERAGTILDLLEQGVRESGCSQAELPEPLCQALDHLGKESGRLNAPTAALDSSTAADDPSAEHSQVERPTYARVDMGRFAARLRRCVVRGDSATLQTIWTEHRPRLVMPSAGPKEQEWKNEVMAKILSACLRCERRFKSVGLQSTISEITASAPKPMPTGIFNVILAHRADVDDYGALEEGEEAEMENDHVGSEGQETSRDEGWRPTLKTLRLAWNMAQEQGVMKDLKSYMIYMEGLGISGDIEGLRQTWSALLADPSLKADHAKATDKSYPPVVAFNQMLSAALRIPRVGPPFALELFDGATQFGSPSINIITINVILRHHARMADISSMTSLFSLAAKNGLQPDVVTYTTLVQGLLRAERVEMANAVLSKMLSEGLEPNERMCSLLVSDLARSGSQAGLQRAEEMMREMKRKDMAVTQVTWTSLISGYFRGGWESDAWAAIERMGRSGVKLNRVGYNMILKQGKGAWCLRVFQKMIKEGIPPNSDTFFIVLNPFVQRKQWHEADQVIQEMRRMGFRPEKAALRRLVSRVEARR